MFCIHCGTQMKEGDLFCSVCGNPVEPPAEDSTPVPPPSAPFEEEAPTELVAPAIVVNPSPPVPPPRRGKGKLIAAILIPVLLLVLGAGCYFGYQFYSTNRQFQALMAEAERAMEDEAFETAADCYEQSLALKPEDYDAALGLARARLRSGDAEEAVKALDGLNLPETDERFEAYQRLQSIAALEPELDGVDTSNFPLMTIKLNYQGEFALTQDQLQVSENGTSREITAFQAENGVITLTYQTEDTDISAEKRPVTVTLAVDDVAFHQESDYETPTFSPASVSLVSTDVSQYPLVRAYFRVEDPASGANVAGLDVKAFSIRERVQGGEYLAREVKTAAPLEGNAGLNINLVADKSSSIDPYDMDKIRQVMTEFVRSLHFDVGDKAEIQAFDSIVQQMCYYTNDSTLLVNGINNMSPDGRTAFYDAVYLGVNHSALQGGARCVIAFTDGMDNESTYTADEVINYATSQQVPVYIIGVGSSVDTYVLQRMAQGTGGRYWFIDDLYDLQEIFDTIYAKQKELYVVEYQSDMTIDSHQVRDLSVVMTGGGYRAECEDSFQPVRTINDQGGVQRSGRYEIFMEALSWEQAAQRCQEMGGHLATITSQNEMDELTAMAETAGAKYLWLGGYTSYDGSGAVFGHWVTGEEFAFQAWGPDEPSRVDQDGTEEWYIMLWNIPSMGGWNWNDQRNDPAAVMGGMKSSMGFICEFDS